MCSHSSTLHVLSEVFWVVLAEWFLLPSSWFVLLILHLEQHRIAERSLWLMFWTLFPLPLYFSYRLILRPRRTMMSRIVCVSLFGVWIFIVSHLFCNSDTSLYEDFSFCVWIIFAFCLVTMCSCEQEIIWPVFSKTYSCFQLLFLYYLGKVHVPQVQPWMHKTLCLHLEGMWCCFCCPVVLALLHCCGMCDGSKGHLAVALELEEPWCDNVNNWILNWKFLYHWALF